MFDLLSASNVSFLFYGSRLTVFRGVFSGRGRLFCVLYFFFFFNSDFYRWVFIVVTVERKRGERVGCG